MHQVSCAPKTAVPAVLNSAATRLREAEQLKGMGRALWWKMREVALLALGLLAACAAGPLHRHSRQRADPGANGNSDVLAALLNCQP